MNIYCRIYKDNLKARPSFWSQCSSYNFYYFRHFKLNLNPNITYFLVTLMIILVSRSKIFKNSSRTQCNVLCNFTYPFRALWDTRPQTTCYITGGVKYKSVFSSLRNVFSWFGLRFKRKKRSRQGGRVL